MISKSLRAPAAGAGGTPRAGEIRSRRRARRLGRTPLRSFQASALGFLLPALAGLLPLAAAFPRVAAAAPAAAGEAGATVAPAVWRAVPGLSPRALAAALDAVTRARARGVAGRDGLLTLIDYSLPSTSPRLWVLDLARGRVLFHELVAHGAGSGDNYATRFSNADQSRQSSLGLFLTGGTYEGGNGYSLKLSGLDPGVNDLAEQRHIVMHGAWYVSADHAQHFGRLGRSWGCPALPVTSAHAVIDTIKGGSFLYAYAAGDASPMSSLAKRQQARTPSGPACAPAAAPLPAPAGPQPAPLAATAAPAAAGAMH
jgi:hypothetical protein